MPLHALFARSAREVPERDAVVDTAGAASYGAVDALAHRITRALAERGVVPGDRVGIWLDKSVKSVAAMQAVLRAGAAYVPLDVTSPPARIEKILRDCPMRTVITDAKRAAALPGVACITTSVAQGLAWPELDAFSADPVPSVAAGKDDLAYVLYTSGSTGTPKGVCISHGNARAFVDWAVSAVGLGRDDRLSCHAPFQFDLSVFDLYGAFSVGAAVCLVPETLAYMPQRLVPWAAEHRITVWYSVPSVLVLMLDKGGLNASTLPALRTVIFAGEAYPLPQLRKLRQELPHVRLFNFYGPTETNVCTFHEVGDLPAEQTAPVPIGRACSGDDVWVVKPDGARANVGEEGELFVAGPTVMLGYWGKEPQRGPYATGDLVRVVEPGVFTYVARKDRLVKVGGHRVELGDIEAALLEHENVREAAVLVRGQGPDARIVACVVPSRQPPPSLLALKGHSAQRLPRYMIPDEVKVLSGLPRTTNGKLDQETLLASVTPARQ